MPCNKVVQTIFDASASRLQSTSTPNDSPRLQSCSVHSWRTSLYQQISTTMQVVLRLSYSTGLQKDDRTILAYTGRSTTNTTLGVHWSRPQAGRATSRHRATVSNLQKLLSMKSWFYAERRIQPTAPSVRMRTTAIRSAFTSFQKQTTQRRSHTASSSNLPAIPQ